MKTFFKMLGIILFLVVFLSGCSIVIDELFSDEPQLPLEEALEKYTGEKAFTYSDGNYLYFYQANDNIEVIIDNGLDEVYIEGTKNAVELYDSLPGITMTWIVKPSDEIVWEGDGYDKVIVSYYRNSEKDICGDDDTDVLACNEFWFNEEGQIYASEIHFNLDAMPEDPDPLLVEAIAIHELGHTFGLDDLYQDSLEGHSIMYYQTDTDFPEILTLTDWDKENLAWMYNKEE